MICNRQFGGSVRDCVRCRVPGGWLECPPEARGILVPASVAAAANVAAASALEPPTISAAGFSEQPQPTPSPIPPQPSAAPPPPSRVEQYNQSRAMGFTGDICSHCGSPNMTRNGTCTKCNDCGETSGCS